METGLAGFHFPLITCCVWRVPWAGYIMALSSYSVLGRLLHLIIIIIRIACNRWTHTVKNWEDSANACWVYSVELVSSVPSFSCSCNRWGCMCSTDAIWFDDHKDISTTSLNLTYCCHIFHWLWDLGWLYEHILSVALYQSGNAGLLFLLLPCSLWCVQIFRNVMAIRSYSFVGTSHHLTIIIAQSCMKELNV